MVCGFLLGKRSYTGFHNCWVIYMNLEDLNLIYDKMQKKYGARELDSVYGGGCVFEPNVCFVFMNPTGRNIASSKDWHGPKYPWIGTKNVWNIFYQLDLLDQDLYEDIRKIKGKDWDVSFALKVYENVKKHRYFFTNLCKCTQIDARALSDAVLKKYLFLLKKEISIIKPKVVILFGNQVSSIVLGKKIAVSEVRRKKFLKKIDGVVYTFYAVYYPVGNGRFNLDKAIEDVHWIFKEEGIF